MANGQQPPINLNQALETLAKLQAVAPAGTADKLAQVAALVQGLSDENAYLSTLLLDDGISTRAPVKPTPQPEPTPIRSTNEARTVTSILRDMKAETETDPTAALLTGLSEALRPPLV